MSLGIQNHLRLVLGFESQIKEITLFFNKNLSYKKVKVEVNKNFKNQVRTISRLNSFYFAQFLFIRVTNNFNTRQHHQSHLKSDVSSRQLTWQGKFINTWKNVCSNKPQKAYKQHNKILLDMVHYKLNLNLVYALSTRSLCQTKITQDAITTRAYRRVEVKFIAILLELSFFFFQCMRNDFDVCESTKIVSAKRPRCMRNDRLPSVSVVTSDLVERQVRSVVILKIEKFNTSIN